MVFIPNDLLFGEKTHHRVLIHNFLNIIREYLIDGIFQMKVMELLYLKINMKILFYQRLFDIIAARGVSILSHVYLPNFHLF